MIENPGVVPPEHEYLTVECTNMNECTKNRCEYETFWALELSKVLTDNVIQGNEEVPSANQFLDADACVRGNIGTAADGCCGESPTWELFNTASQTCVAGVLV